jgi:hypothetical protein
VAKIISPPFLFLDHFKRFVGLSGKEIRAACESMNMASISVTTKGLKVDDLFLKVAID